MVSFLEIFGTLIFYSEPLFLILATSVIFWFNILQSLISLTALKLLKGILGNFLCYLMVATAFH